MTIREHGPTPPKPKEPDYSKLRYNEWYPPVKVNATIVRGKFGIYVGQIVYAVPPSPRAMGPGFYDKGNMPVSYAFDDVANVRLYQLSGHLFYCRPLLTLFGPYKNFPGINSANEFYKAINNYKNYELNQIRNGPRPGAVGANFTLPPPSGHSGCSGGSGGGAPGGIPQLPPAGGSGGSSGGAGGTWGLQFGQCNEWSNSIDGKLGRYETQLGGDCQNQRWVFIGTEEVSDAGQLLQIAVFEREGEYGWQPMVWNGNSGASSSNSPSDSFSEQFGPANTCTVPGQASISPGLGRVWN